MTGDPLRIGVIAPPWVPVPPPSYGGTELMIDVLCNGLQRRGHDVTLFSTKDSTCPVTHRWLLEHSDPDRMGNVLDELRHAAAAYDEFAHMDVVHDHTLAGMFVSERVPDLPVTTTVHGPLDGALGDFYTRVDERIPLVAISHDQASRAPGGVRIAAVVHHGVDLARYPFVDAPRGEHALSLGRMSPAKGIETAIACARRAGVPLLIAAKMREPIEHRYFEERIRPALGNGVDYVGEVDFDEKVRLLTSAIALLNPIEWPEPFGLVMIEAMACGTPVVSTPCGAATEIVVDGETGFFGASVDELAAALETVDAIERRRCRAHVERSFSAMRMVDDYVALYRSMLGAATLPPSSKVA